MECGRSDCATPNKSKKQPIGLWDPQVINGKPKGNERGGKRTVRPVVVGVGRCGGDGGGGVACYFVFR